SLGLSASGGAGAYTFKLNNNSVQGSISGLQAGVYHVEVTDASGCSVLKDVSLVAPVAMELNATVENEKCGQANTGSVSINVIGGNAPYTYTWNNSMTGNTISQLGAGTYVVAVVDAKGCTQTKANVVNASQGLRISAVANELPCNVAKGEASVEVLNGLAPYNFMWSNGGTASAISNVVPGTYTVSIRDAAGCVMDTAIVVRNNNSFNVAVEGAGFINLGETVELKASSTGSDVSYTWVPAFGLQCPTCASVTVRPAETTTYKVTAIDGVYGCVATAEAQVQVSTETNVFLPNAFTPNGDGENDVLQLYGNLQSIRYFQLLVFNRWGEKVYETNDQFFNWDANYKGEKLEPGAYLYVMKIVHLNNETSRTFKGSISLLK
ncbi:MAG: gliding motility-associated C-terminal domain-containing protein, partial [Bacteroidetes bacterium]|nr:gliding motility-associated C-terminal domain-containing protein [Bacteroidota bacterium]